MKEQELTDMLIHALDNSQNGFSELKRMFNECADAFEIGDDVKGLTVMNQILPSLSDFSNFCADMITTHHHQINDELMNQLTEQCEQFQSLLGDMVAEMEDSNLVEVGDILKYDLGDLVVQISKTFPQIAEALKKDISCVG